MAVKRKLGVRYCYGLFLLLGFCFFFFETEGGMLFLNTAGTTLNVSYIPII